ncbi:hypothetical protein OTG34_03015, partial [Escherichia coli]|uniref:hypothetical protein n=1 Tax=Escherichia coli TaxID=562 RepID=UPI002264A92F
IKRLLNVYRNVYRIDFRICGNGFIAGGMACCSVPFAPAIFVVSDFLYYLNSSASDFSQSP